MATAAAKLFYDIVFVATSLDTLLSKILCHFCPTSFPMEYFARFHTDTMFVKFLQRILKGAVEVE